jgi:hypothetical protein
MEWLLTLVLAGGGVAGWRRWAVRRARRRTEAEELDGVRAMADEDVTVLGEELQRLGDRTAEGMDEATRVDYQTALDAYESAKRAVPRLRSAHEVSTVVDILSTGRYALACVQAGLEGRPVPELRVPCFFNPQHGPSVSDVRWTAPGRGTRTVPACAQDAARVARGETPQIRSVKVGVSLAPYWEAGAAYLPYGRAYFSTAVLESGYRVQSPDSWGGGISI